MDPVLSDLKVPCSRTYPCYSGPFGSYSPTSSTEDLRQYGIHLETASSIEFTECIQAELCFCLVADACRTCGVSINPDDFVMQDEQGDRLLSYQNLDKYIWFLVAAEYSRDIDCRRRHQANYMKGLKRASGFINTRNSRLPRSEALMDASQLTEAAVLVASMALVGYLVHNTFIIFHLGQVTLEISWVRSPLLDQRLRNIGWCKGEINGLYSECQPTVLLYFCTIKRSRGDKSHGHCLDDACLVNQLDDTTYETVHAQACAGVDCQIVKSPVQVLCDVLNDGAIPIIRFVEEVGARLDIKRFIFGDKKDDSTYTAISHVWSDGMGNRKVNGLYHCQLKRIQDRVDALYPDTKGNNFFWMDTLCVPLRTAEKTKAIILMAKTFAHATKVLVLDRWLEGFDSRADTRELLVRIAKCDWNTRLWTYQELALAQRCIFQFSSETATLGQLSNHVSTAGNVQRLSNYLGLLQNEDFTERNYAMALLKAITDIDQSLLNKLVRDSELPSQDDEAKEEKRNFAIAYCHLNQHIMETWKPRIEQLGDSYTSQPTIDGLRGHLSVNIFDPILSYGMTVLHRLQGTYYPTTMDRSKDVGGITRQLHGFDTKPHVLLIDVGPGLLGRTTSRQEDETICLGGMLGLDVSSILNFTIDPTKQGKERQKEVFKVCDERMRTFMLLLKQVFPTVAFCNVDRVQLKGFHWAPRTFLGKQQTIRREFGQYASISTEGLLLSSSGIRLVGQRLSDICRAAKIRIRFEDSNTRDSSRQDHPLGRSWTYTNLHLDFYSPPDIDQNTLRDFLLVIDRGNPHQGFLALIDSEKSEPLTCQYLMYATRILQNIREGHLPVIGYWCKELSLCIT